MGLVLYQARPNDREEYSLDQDKTWLLADLSCVDESQWLGITAEAHFLTTSIFVGPFSVCGDDAFAEFCASARWLFCASALVHCPSWLRPRRAY